MGKYDDIRDNDWRLQGVTTAQSASANSSIDVSRGDIIKLIVPTTFRGQRVTLGLPNATVLFLNLSQRMFLQAERLRVKGLRGRQKHHLNDKLAFSFFERTMASLVFAFNALEAFANAEIPDEHLYYRKRRSLYVAQSKPSIERWVGLDTKLGIIIPDVLNIPSPKGTSVWADYVGLKELRDRITHLKTQD